MLVKSVYRLSLLAVSSPEAVSDIGGSDLKRGHNILNKFIRKARTKYIQHLQRLPPA